MAGAAPPAARRAFEIAEAPGALEAAAPETGEAEAASRLAVPDSRGAEAARGVAARAHAAPVAGAPGFDPAPAAPQTAAADGAPRFAAESGQDRSVPPARNGGAGAGLAEVGQLDLGEVAYDATGAVSFSGTAAPGARLVAYIDGRAVGATTVAADGTWRLAPAEDIEPGDYDLRIEAAGAAGAAARLDTPFRRSDIGRTAVAEGLAVVQVGSSLWSIARKIYGRGERHIAIFEANRDRIDDPDLIFPGQILFLPSMAAEG